MSFIDRVRAFINPNETKVNPAYQGMIGYSNTPKAVQMPKNYKSYAKEAYRGNDTVFKCISYIARNGSAIPPILYTDRTKKKRIDNHPLLDKLNRPNLEQSGVAYREAILSYKLLSGNAYQYSIRKGKAGPPDELWSLRPDLVEIVPSPSRGIVGYKYEFLENNIDPTNIAHSKYWNPDNDLYGLSPIEVGALLIDQQKAARTWNLALLQNSARPPGAWTVPTTLGKNERDRLENKLKEKLQGYKNAGTPPVLDGGLNWVNMAASPSELDWLKSLQYNSNVIANLYNIAPQLVGDQGATTYNNLEQAKAASYTEAIFPELDDLYDLWNVWLVPMYPDLKDSGAYLYYDKESVECIQKILQDQKNAQAQRANVMWLNGQCTLNEARVLAGLPEVPYGDIYRIGGILVQASDMEAYALQSMTEPAAPPIAQAEPLNVDPSQEQSQDKPVTQQKPTQKPAPAQQSEQKPQEKPNENASKSFTMGWTGEFKALNAQADAILSQGNDGLSSHSQKKLDSAGIYQPDDLTKQLAGWQKQGALYLEWECTSSACDVCIVNDGQIVPIGQPFKSGHILPGAHPHCDCKVKASNAPAKTTTRETYRKVTRLV